MSQEADPVIQIEDLVNRFDDFLVHDHLNLTVDRGQILGVVGGSGSGKSVLMNTILGLQKQQSGKIILLGHDQNKIGRKEWRKQRSRIGVLFQGGALFSALSVIDNIMAPLFEFTKFSAHEARTLALMKLSMVGLPMRSAALYPSELSGGMIKRVALARAMALDPELLFLDEPTAGLDPIGAAAFDELIKELSVALRVSIFMITHDLDSIYALCDQVAVLADKKLVAKDRVENLEKSDHPWIRNYFLGPRGKSRLGAVEKGQI